MSRPIRYCRVCGAAFAASPADSTVNCPEHRRRRPTAPAAPSPADLRRLEARAEAWRFRRTYGVRSSAYRAVEASYLARYGS